MPFEQESFPYDGKTYSAEVLARMIGALATNGVVYGIGGMLQVYGDGSGLKVKVKTGEAFIGSNGGAVANRRHFRASGSPDIEKAIAANASGLPRLDRLILRHNANATAPENRVLLDVLQGVPATNPSSTPLLRSGAYYDLCLASIYVPSGATNVQAPGPGETGHSAAQAYVTDTREDENLCGWVNRSGTLRLTGPDNKAHRTLYITRSAGQVGSLIYVDDEFGNLLYRMNPNASVEVPSNSPEAGYVYARALSGADGSGNQFLAGHVEFRAKRTAIPTVTASGAFYANEGSGVLALDLAAGNLTITPNRDGFYWSLTRAGTTKFRGCQFNWSIG